MMKWLFLLFIAGCAQVTGLNMKKHEFGILPARIIWLQIAGLEEEQIAMLRFQYAAERKTSFEEHVCLGKTWSYNLYQLRNSAETTFLSQLTGKKNIKQSCEDAELRPIWDYLSGNGYKTGILEILPSDKQTILSMNQCGDSGKKFLDSLHLWLRKAPPADAATFHYSELVPVVENSVFYDRTCTSKECSSTIADDFKGVYKQFQKTSPKHLMIIRDFSYLAALESKQTLKARSILSDLERTLAEALSYANATNAYLILITSGDSRYVEMPPQGKQWIEFEKTGAFVSLKQSKLTNLVLASGARAENFCGLYDDSQVFERILSGPKQLGLELKFINPFR
jgi:hypothetical protein